MKNEIQGRLITKFAPFGYTLFADDEQGIKSEFRKDGYLLRFAVRLAEGGIVLLWTENQECNLLDKNPPPDVGYRSFYKGPEEFWAAVADIIEGGH